MIFLCFYYFGNIILILLLFDQLKIPQRIIQIISQIMPQKVCHPRPRKKTKQTEGKVMAKNPVAIMMMKVCVLLFHCYDILMLLLLW